MMSDIVFRPVDHHPGLLLHGRLVSADVCSWLAPRCQPRFGKGRVEAALGQHRQRPDTEGLALKRVGSSPGGFRLGRVVCQGNYAREQSGRLRSLRASVFQREQSRCRRSLIVAL